jgi:competence protein ComFC
MFNKNLFEYLLYLILPKEKDIIEIEKLSEEEILKNISRADTNNSNIKSIFRYKDKIARKIIWEIKYNKNKVLTKKIAKIFYEFILEEISDEISFSNFINPLLIPVPISNKTRKERGYNQCEEILKEIEKLDTNNIFEIDFEIIKKVKETTHQAKIKNRKQRLKNLDGCFEIINKQKVLGRNIILIDDVTTTGATIFEISKTLKNAGANKIIGFALGH